jgi:hypothetical protein
MNETNCGFTEEFFGERIANPFLELALRLSLLWLCVELAPDLF